MARGWEVSWYSCTRLGDGVGAIMFPRTTQKGRERPQISKILDRYPVNSAYETDAAGLPRMFRREKLLVLALRRKGSWNTKKGQILYVDSMELICSRWDVGVSRHFCIAPISTKTMMADY